MSAPAPRKCYRRTVPPGNPSQNPAPSLPVGTQPSPLESRKIESRKETLLAAVFIFYSSVSFFLIEYDRMRPWGAGTAAWLQDKFNGTLSEGDQYRIGIPYLARFLEIHAHLKIIQSVPLIEFIAYALALTLLYLQLRSSPRLQAANPASRMLALGFFFAAVQLPVLWIFPWERLETLPTAFYLSAIVLLVVRRGRTPFALVCLATILLSFAQALMRSDATVISGLAILIIAAFNVPLPRPRLLTAILGLLCCAVGGGTQFYLQHVAFPIVTHTQTPATFQLLANLNVLKTPWHLPIFFTSILPFLFTLYLLRRHRLSLESSDKLVLLISILYLGMWFTLGLANEVRIFVPYLFLASPTIAKLWTAFLFQDALGTGTGLSEPFQ